MDETDLKNKTELVNREAALDEQDNTLLRIIEQEVALTSSVASIREDFTVEDFPSDDLNVNKMAGSGSSSGALSAQDVAAATSAKNPGAIDGSGKSLVGASVSGNIIIRSLIGAGGMSSVYKAWHTQIDREVAVKVMHPHLLSEENALLRFQQEAHAAGKLDHPNVVRVHDFRAGEQGISYIVMDLVDGVALDDELDKVSFLPAERAVKVFTQACDALSHAHAKGVIHRDLKPSNLMLTTNETAPDQVRILDFGIAKVLPQEGDKRAKLTQTGEVFGSPLYMSPEQCMGKTVDHRSDIYSMGCLLYEALTGKPPLEGANAFETFFKHTTEMPSSLKEQRKDLEHAEEFDAIILKAMAKAPAERYQSMAEFKADLEQVGKNVSRGWIDKAKGNVELAKRKHGARGGRLSKPVLATIYTFAVLCVLAATTVTVSYIQSQSTVGSSWEELFQQGQKNFDLGKYDLAEKQFERALELSGSSRVRMAPILRELVDMDRAQGATTGSSPFEEKLNAIESKNKQSAVDELDELCETLGRVSQSLTPQSLKELDAVSHEINHKAGGILTTDPLQWSKSRDALTQVKNALERRDATTANAYARTLHNLAFESYLQGQYASAANQFDAARKVWAKRVTTDRADIKHLLHTMDWQARASNYAGRQDEAEALLKQRLEEARKTGSTAGTGQFINNALLAQSYYSLAEFYTYKLPMRLGESAEAKANLKKAERNLNEAITIYGNLEATDKGDQANCYALLGVVEMRQGQLQNAQDSFLQAKELFETLHQKNSGYWLETIVGLADTYFGQQKFDRAEPLYRHAVAIGSRYIPQLTYAVDNAINKLEQIIDKRNHTGIDRQKDLPVLVSLRQMKLSLDKQQYGDASVQVNADYLNLFSLARGRGDLQAAENYLNEAVAIAEKSKDPWPSVSTFAEKGRFEFDRSNPDKGRENLEKAVVFAQKVPLAEVAEHKQLLTSLRFDVETRGANPSLLKKLDELISR